MRFLCPLAFLLALALPASAQIPKEVPIQSDSSQQVADKPASFFGPFRINGEKSADFKNFDYFILSHGEQNGGGGGEALVPDAQGVVNVSGQVTTIKGSLLDFESVKLVESGPVTHFFRGTDLTRFRRAQPITLSFATLETKGIRYAFKGEYLDDPAEEFGSYTQLRGVLSKYMNGKLVAEQKVAFTRAIFEETVAEAWFNEEQPAGAAPVEDAPGDPR